jgi:DNA-binding SARP family transcriptional activator
MSVLPERPPSLPAGAKAGAPAIAVSLLGGFRVSRDGSVLPAAAWRRRRAADLLKLLAIQPGRALHRESAIATLWPDKDGASGANNLHRALHDLRQQLGPAVAYLDKGVLRLCAHAWVDVEAFVAGTAGGRAAVDPRALDAYRGELCPEDPYAEWLTAPREALRRRFVDASLRLAISLLEDGEAAEAVPRLRRLVEIEPAEEEGHRLLVIALTESGRADEALRQCDRSREALAGAGTVAGKAVEDLAQRLRAAAATPRQAGAARASRRLLGRATPRPLCGRDPEVRALDAFVAEGKGVMVLQGEGGVGKTRLAVEAAALAERAGVLTATAVGLELAQLMPYAPFQECWTDLLRSCGRPAAENPFLVRVGGEDGEPREDKLKLFRAVERSLEVLSGGGGVLLVLDDLHCFDESSLHLVRYLASRVVARPWMLLATCRVEEAAPGGPAHALLTWLYQRHRMRRVVVGPLDEPATARQCAAVLGREVPTELVREVYRLSEGNAFFTEEILFAGAGESRPVQVPPDLGALFQDRLAVLSAPARRALAAAAVVGRRFSVAEVAAAIGASPVDVEQALADAAAARLAVEDEDATWRFRHALAREALYAALSPGDRRAFHFAIAERLATLGGERLAVALHLRAGGDAAGALPHLVEAARQAHERVGFEEAAALWRQALGLMDELGMPPGPDRFRALAALGQLLFVLADVPAAVSALDQAASLADPESGWRPAPEERARARRLGAIALVTNGDLLAAEARLQEARADLAAAPQGREQMHERAQLLYHLAQLRWHEERFAEAYALGEECLRAAEALGKPPLLARAYEMLALACHSLGEWQQGIACERRRGALTGPSLDVAQAFDVHL